jgi:hypothetical protein
MTREAALEQHDRVHRLLRRAALIVCAFGFRWIRFNAKLVECLTRQAGKTASAIEHRLAAAVKTSGKKSANDDSPDFEWDHKGR